MASRAGYTPIGEVPSQVCWKMWSREKRAVCLSVVSLLLTVLFGAGYIIVQVIVHQKIEDGAVLRDGNFVEKQWRKPETPVYAKHYVFDVDNPSEVQNMGAKPSLSQKGPYTYREYRDKMDVQWSTNTTTVSYLQPDYYIFERSMSVGDPKEDQVTALNFILVSILYMINNKVHGFSEKIIADLIDQVPEETLFIKVSVHDFLWGYEDNLLKIINGLDNSIPIKMPLIKNDSVPNPNARYRVYTGDGQVSRRAKLIQWNGMTELPYWNGSARTLKGTEGLLFKPFIGKDGLHVMIDEIFRTVFLSYDRTEKVKGIYAYRFSSRPVNFANVSINPSNADYYNFGPTGLINLTTSIPMNPPFYGSHPYFLDCGSSLVEAVRHMHPNRTRHESFADVEPMTGALLRGAKRLQVNIQLQRDKDIVQLENVPSLYFPLFWGEKLAVITDHLVHHFNSELFIPLTVADNTLIALMLASGLTAVLCFLLAAWFRFSDYAVDVSVNAETT